MTTTRKTRILLADHQGLVLEGIKALLERDFDVAGVATNGRDLIKTSVALQPDVIVLDIGILHLSEWAALGALRAHLPPCRLLYLTTRQNGAVARQAMHLGPAGYVLKSAPAFELIHAIREVAAGRTYFAPDNDKAPEGSENRSRRRMDARCMTLRQREVIQLLAEGGSMKEVASVLKITARTVAYHKYTVMQQHQLKTNAELIQFAIRQQVVAV